MDEKQLGGICIGVKQWKENDKMLSVFCEDGCIYGVLARGALKPKYKLKFASQLFSACDYHLCETRAGYFQLYGASFSEMSFLGIASDPLAYAAACLVCEIAAKCTMGENKRMYAELIAALGELASGSERCDIVVLRVLMAAFVSGGFGMGDPRGEYKKICDAVINSPAGHVSELDFDKDKVSALIKSYASHFTVRFDKLAGLDFFLNT